MKSVHAIACVKGVVPIGWFSLPCQTGGFRPLESIGSTPFSQVHLKKGEVVHKSESDGCGGDIPLGPPAIPEAAGCGVYVWRRYPVRSSLFSVSGVAAISRSVFHCCLRPDVKCVLCNIHS